MMINKNLNQIIILLKELLAPNYFNLTIGVIGTLFSTFIGAVLAYKYSMKIQLKMFRKSIIVDTIKSIKDSHIQLGKLKITIMYQIVEMAKELHLNPEITNNEIIERGKSIIESNNEILFCITNIQASILALKKEKFYPKLEEYSLECLNLHINLEKLYLKVNNHASKKDYKSIIREEESNSEAQAFIFNNIGRLYKECIESLGDSLSK